MVLKPLNPRAEFISDPEELSEQLIDIAVDKLVKNPQTRPICPELELDWCDRLLAAHDR